MKRLFTSPAALIELSVVALVFLSFGCPVLGAGELKNQAPPKQAANIFESTVPAKPASVLDEIVFARLAKLGIKPVLCSDAVFVRRAYIDMIGTLPTAEEALAFIDDPDLENKHAKLIDRLLERDEFADYWSMKWGDVLRIKAEFPVNLWPNAAQAYHRWIRASIAANKPYDQFAREMLTASGSNFRVGPVNFYRAIQNKTPEGIATTVALTFMGARTQHWPKERLDGMAVFFSQVGYKPTSEWKEENVFWDPLRSSVLPGTSAPGQASVAASVKISNDPLLGTGTPTNKPPHLAVFPDGTKVKLPSDRDPREVFAEWLISPKNPWFTRSIVNRVCEWLLGRGIVHEPDDIREANPPSNRQLEAYLEKELIASGYDLKKFYRLILTSSVYRFSSMPRYNSAEAVANYAGYPLRRLEAEVLIDAVNKITGTTDLYTSPIPEPFTYIPKDMPAIAVADGSITSSFLALFGRSQRATGMASERNNKLVPSQWLHMLNSGHIQAKLQSGPKLKEIVYAKRSPEESLRELYLTVLSRPPTAEEVAIAKDFAKPAPVAKGKKLSKSAARAAFKAAILKRRDDWVDLTWSLINSTEFLYRH